MKKNLLLLLSLCFSVVAFGENQEVKMETTSTTTITRSIIQKPCVTINDQTFDLSVAFTSNENFTLNVYDKRGVIIFQEMLISDGARHSYQLPMLEFGEYTVSIEGEKSSFEGTFSL